MARSRQPATPSTARDVQAEERRRTRADDPALHEEASPGMRALRRGWALTRWVVLIGVVGLGTAVVIAIAMAALAALVNASI